MRVVRPPRDDSRIKWQGLAEGGFFGVLSAVITLIRGVPTSAAGKVGSAVGVIALFLLWGWGIAHSGAKGISKVEIQIDDAPWEAVGLREPLSELTWVIWRYDWPFAEGGHHMAVRAYDGQERLQETKDRVSGPSAATGLFKEYRDIPPLSP
jgi:hypothetical protein